MNLEIGDIFKLMPLLRLVKGLSTVTFSYRCGYLSGIMTGHAIDPLTFLRLQYYVVIFTLQISTVTSLKSLIPGPTEPNKQKV